MRILFAAPDRDLLECYSKILQDDLTEVVTAFDGTQVASLLATEPFDIAILDKNIPRMDHEKLVTRIQNKGIPVMILTDRPISAHELTKTPLPNAHLSYPFTPEKISAEISNILKNVLSDEHLQIGTIEVDVPKYQMTGGLRLTAGEIYVLRALSNGETVTTDYGASISALNIKLAKTGLKTRIQYKSQKGFEMVTENE
ncbi:MAG: response regulator [Clostridia bacterium]|nr:response regulator [Clostridia bacterium]